MWRCVIVAALIVGLQCTSGERCVPRRYNTSSSRMEGMLNVHIVPHTHDDTGWLKTIDQYYFGSRQDIQLAGVQYVLDTLVQALIANPDRKFSYAEMSFFTRWWFEQTEEHQERVKKLVEDGQLDFMNGGWVQHDEAASHYVAMIDQTTRGHRFLNETFGFRPLVGWQIDPFGHSATHASLLAGFLGFDGLFFGRSDYQDIDLRRKSRKLEFLWRGAKSFGDEADIFTGNFAGGNYGPPEGFNYEWGQYDPQVQDNVCLVEYNLGDRVEHFVQQAQGLAAMTRGEDIMFTMGTDFTYSNAFPWFKNMDKLIHYANLDGRINAFYSTPSAYVKAKHSYNASWPLKTDDFFPYADCPTCFWTGYFTSRPTSKGYIRAGTSYLQAARQLELLTGYQGKTDALEEAVSLLQHHDSITGTEKQHVANDYHLRLARGWAQAEAFVSKALSHLVYNKDALTMAGAIRRPLALVASAAEPADLLLLLKQCPQLNVSVCETSVKASQGEDPLLVVVYNPLAWPRHQGVRVPLAANDSVAWSVTDDEGKEVASQLIHVSETTRDLQQALHENGALPNLATAAQQELAFIAHVPPLGYASYVLKQTPKETAVHGSAFVSLLQNWTGMAVQDGEDDTQVLSQGALQLTVSKSTGRLIAMRNSNGEGVALETKGAWYNSSDAVGPPPGESGVASGAYIFRPNGVFQPTGPTPVHVLEGPVLTEVRQVFLEYLSVTTRLWKGQDHAEVEWTAGPIPIADGLGKELVLRYESNLSTGSTFYTDANGRELQKRVLDFRPTWNLTVTEPIAGNYYPLTAAIAIKDEDEAELSVLVDRAQGGSSLTSGSIEVMIHRRTLLDDIRGVNEPLNETLASCQACDSPGLVARGTHLLALQKPSRAAAQRRILQQLLNDPVLLAFGPVPHVKPSQGNTAHLSAINGRFSALHRSQDSLPENVHLLTSKVLEDGRVLLRVAHLFQVDEDAGELAKSVTVDLNSLFQGLTFNDTEELALGGAQPLDKIKRLGFRAGEPLSSEGAEKPINFTRGKALSCTSDCADEALDVELSPMEIRTFLLTIAESSRTPRYVTS